MEFRFDDKTVWVTGAGSGIGRAAAIAFAEAGAQVLLSDINEQGGAETLDLIASLPGAIAPAHFAALDVTDRSATRSILDSLVNAHSQYHSLDIGVNCAGIEGPNARVADLEPEQWHQVMDVNLNGVYYCMQAELAHMLRQPSGGAIVNIASVAGVVGFPWHAAYAASKHAVVGLTRSTALEYARKNIRINAVCPGFTDTPMVTESSAADTVFFDQLLTNIPVRRLGTPEEIAAAILYLASDQAGFTTGHTMMLDGGITAG